jgi:hypothetical protein
MTHRSLLAVVLAPVVWDLPLVVHWRYRLRVALLRCSSVRSPSSDVFCCNPWFVVTADKITTLIIAALSLSPALTLSLQTISYSDHTFLDTQRPKRTLSFHGCTRKNLSLKTQFVIVNITFILKLWGTRMFSHCTDTLENNNFYTRSTNTPEIKMVMFCAQTLPKTREVLYSVHKHSRIKQFYILCTNTPENKKNSCIRCINNPEIKKLYILFSNTPENIKKSYTLCTNTTEIKNYVFSSQTLPKT